MDTELSKMNDHDLLVTMHEQIKGIKSDIKEIKDGTSTQLKDHEDRIRILETDNSSFKGKYAIVAFIVTVIVSIAASWITRHI